MRARNALGRRLMRRKIDGAPASSNRYRGDDASTRNTA
jgi:hypothetical protein